MSLAETCETEIRELHDFFQDWFTGDRPRTNDEFARLESAIGADFQQIGPDGGVAPRSAIMDAVEGLHGAAESGEAADRIEIEAVDPRFVTDEICLMTYEEHQRTEGTWRGRRSTALFERAEAAPNGVVWRHLHETWLPD